jgi:hypothetical protein
VAVIITLDDLPLAIRSNELAQTMVDGANAKATRVAPCLASPEPAAWVASTAYLLGDRVTIGDTLLQVTVAGTSSDTEPDAPTVIGRTVTDGTVTWERIEPTSDQLDEAKLILIGAVKRWAEASSGALQSESVDDYSRTIDTRQRTGFNLWPSEIEALQAICGPADSPGAFTVDSVPSTAVVHADTCSVNFGATYCSCGAVLTGMFALYETT